MSRINFSRAHPWYHATRQTLVFRESNARLWHSFLFMANIGVPALVGLSMGNLRAGLTGAVVGLLLSLSDSTDAITKRLYLLARATGMLLLFGFLGHSFGGYTIAFWATFVALTFATGWWSLSGNSRAPALRYGALALISTAGLPGTSIITALMVLTAAGISALTRALGSWRFPEAEYITTGPITVEMQGGLAGLRYCIVYAATVGTGLIIGQFGGLEHPVWVATTVLLVMQPDSQSSYRRIVQRVFGTFIGVILATLIVHLFHSLWFLTAAVLAIAFLIPQGTSRNYWLHSALTALLILVLYDFASSGHGFDFHLLTARIEDVILGCLLALIGTMLALSPLQNRANEQQTV